MRPPLPRRDDTAPRRLLIRGVNWLGDAIMTTPAMMRLRQAFPRWHIALLTPAKLAGLWIDHPALDQMISFDPSESCWQIGRRLRSGGFELGLIFPNSARSALELWLARIPFRAGLAGRWRAGFLTHPIEPRPGIPRMKKRSAAAIRRALLHPPTSPAPPAAAHHVFHYLHLAASIGADPSPMPPCLRVSSRETAAVLGRLGLALEPSSGARYVGLNPGAEYGPAKRWPVDRFVDTVRRVSARARVHWLLFGGGSDRAACEEIAGAVEASDAGGSSPAIANLAGRTSLRDLCVLLGACRALLTNDTGPMHVAAAVGTPVVVPFGSTSPAFTGPGLPGDPRHRLLRSAAPCAPCFRPTCPIDSRCLREIAAESAAAALLDLLGELSR
ncbi:MAG TPA: lipopolysaccharide heptosyltransferase II [Candidatus Paceibacterota bacterium]|nr:lipopolysaccharide heptosyltransferase II [Verrucomicrobiota bacterium]HOX02290.1 lipopolysaccharide heptosyltransferase II [Verrucomicrobiota bacterium]HRZ45082.1 lipopolysaccharide heptosyltransferase II [Candidatus Paceibacterota bacterium]HRZ94383.1 lipopolysaccharide heptosyltransferase II [Candidatus Paceibacterota bacterium]